MRRYRTGERIMLHPVWANKTAHLCAGIRPTGGGWGSPDGRWYGVRRHRTGERYGCTPYGRIKTAHLCAGIRPHGEVVWHAPVSYGRTDYVAPRMGE